MFNHVQSQPARAADGDTKAHRVLLPCYLLDPVVQLCPLLSCWPELPGVQTCVKFPSSGRWFCNWEDKIAVKRVNSAAYWDAEQWDPDLRWGLGIKKRETIL